MNVAHYNKDPKVNPIVFDIKANVISAMLLRIRYTAQERTR